MPIYSGPQGPQAFVGKEAVDFFRMATVLRGMKSELATGMRMTSKAPSCFTIARRDYGLKGNKQKLIEQMEKLVAEKNKTMEYVKNA